jgi:murein DD-endopeptidase MepM/ murein hydrolase activator NlpD
LINFSKTRTKRLNLFATKQQSRQNHTKNNLQIQIGQKFNKWTIFSGFIAFIAVLTITTICACSHISCLNISCSNDLENFEKDSMPTMQQNAHFYWPLPGNFEVTSNFGKRPDPITGKEIFHTGIDLASPEFTPFFAVADGKVESINNSDAWANGFGYYVKLQHGGDFETFYAHCAEILANQNQEVKAGEKLGLIGKTGRATGPHLHFELHKNSRPRDPLLYLKSNFSDQKCTF